MSLAAAIPSEDEDDAMRERRCIVSAEVLSEDRLIRFAVSPDGDIVPDVAATLPGRGIWVEATTKAVAAAVKKNLFAKAAKAQVKAAAEDRRREYFKRHPDYLPEDEHEDRDAISA